MLIKPIWVLTENLVQNEIGHEQYGTYSSLFSLVLVFSVLADWGINNFSTHQIAKDGSKYSTVYNSFFILRVAITLFYPALMMSVGYLLGFDLDEIKLLGVVALTQSLVYFLMFFRAKFQAFQHFKLDGFMSIVERVVLIIFVFLLLNKGLNLEQFINARLIAVVVAVLISYTFVTRLYGFVKTKI